MNFQLQNTSGPEKQPYTAPVVHSFGELSRVTKFGGGLGGFWWKIKKNPDPSNGDDPFS